jgi:hypothetical protein
MATIEPEHRMTSAARAISLSLIFLVTSIGALALAQDADLPTKVKAALDVRRADCNDQKKPFKLGPDAIRKLDLSGEGHADYILDDSAVSCGGEYGWCGSGGCGVVIFMQTANGYAKVFDDLGGSLKVMRKDKGYMIVVPQRDSAGARLVFDHGCAVNLAHGKSRSCKVEE